MEVSLIVILTENYIFATGILYDQKTLKMKKKNWFSKDLIEIIEQIGDRASKNQPKTKKRINPHKTTELFSNARRTKVLIWTDTR